MGCPDNIDLIDLADIRMQVGGNSRQVVDQFRLQCCASRSYRIPVAEIDIAPPGIFESDDILTCRPEMPDERSSGKALAPVIRMRSERPAIPVPPQICLDHDRAEGIERGCCLPAQNLAGIAGIADQQFHFRRAEEGGLTRTTDLAGFGAAAGFIDAFALPVEFDATFAKAKLTKSRTGVVRPVARTNVSGLSCSTMRTMPST